MPDSIRRKRRRKPAERRSKCRIQSGGKEERGMDGNRHNGRRRCRHTMTEKWTNRKTGRKMRSQNSRTQNNGKGRNNEIRDIERRRRANGGGAHRTTRAETGGREKRERERGKERKGKREKGREKKGIAGIPARTGHTGNGKQKIIHSTKKRKPFSLPLFCL